MVQIDTARLRLRPACPGDVEVMHAVLSHPAAMRYWSTPPHDGLDLTREWLAAMIGIPAEVGEDFVVEHEDRVIGKAWLWRFPEVGFILHPDRWGQGLAAEALTAVLDRAFTVHGLAAVTADVDPRNTTSLRLLGKLGFRETGRRRDTFCVAGEWSDSIDLALAREAWRKKRNGALSGFLRRP
ncbi:GNAT family N-acetyltransferase [Rubellimicrobium aerolatum]|uniref:GNAT family N-acetyltransferase n=1 Tax=Rubellimicrobium aerolatum TaxID=490979 RepID=A0ABW0SDL5_9RHOB